MIRVLFCIACLVAGPAAAENALDWLIRQAGNDLRPHLGGSWHPVGGRIFASDPLTLLQTEGATLDVPDGPAALFGLLEPDQGRAALMALIWSDAPVACGEDLTTIAVDTGLAGFLTPSDVAALRAYSTPDEGTYHGSYAEQLDASVPTVPFIVTLPGARFPVSGSGWGDGGYPVARLVDEEGETIALYSQFIPADDTWLLPPPCPGATP